MDELLAKLTNLSYEFFGVILPGIIAALFLALWWAALGPVAPLWSAQFFPQLTASNASAVIDSLSVTSGVGAAVPGIAITYFLGHVLLWVARSGAPDPVAATSARRRVLVSLLFRIPKPPDSYEPKLQPLYDAVQARFTTGAGVLPWVQFYPVVKSYIARNLSYSLVATYQNKYTLHRSITAAAAGLFWLTLVAAVGGAVGFWINGVGPRWGLISAVAALSLLLVWGFSSSYMYHWKMFGNTIITESYSIICGPTNAEPRQ